ncbi:unnamed protein product [Pleuronectes platessa]|uniref:Uncharacterized protein n=1 Tax=Pleuronectes platessa TaxID=8262 RepID=A0A9N7UBH4_PLEPL|nr:unnamed protein product [Pleuronectes platessa]
MSEGPRTPEPTQPSFPFPPLNMLFNFTQKNSEPRRTTHTHFKNTIQTRDRHEGDIVRRVKVTGVTHSGQTKEGCGGGIKAVGEKEQDSTTPVSPREACTTWEEAPPPQPAPGLI